ncbi:MAG: HupE/UreJ family protein [Cytophagaceae bacterium]
MQSSFDFFKLGMHNIIFLNVYGHFLLIITLCGIYTLPSWRKVASFLSVFIGAFIVTFLVSAFDLFEIPTGVFNYLVPLTILVISISNFYRKKQVFTNRYPTQSYRYYLSFISGLIHGFAFQNALIPLYEDEILNNLVAFKLGVISSLALIAFFLLLTAFIATYFVRVHLREWNLIISGACAGIAVYMMANI